MRVVTKYVHKIQKTAWDMRQEKSQRAAAPPFLNWPMKWADMAIHRDIIKEKNERGEHVEDLGADMPWQEVKQEYRRSDFGL